MILREQYLAKIRPFFNSDLIKVIVGIRRAGKSVLLRQIIAELMENGVDDSHVIYLNFEDLENSFIKDQMDLNKYIKDRLIDDRIHYLFFDEIQSVKNFEKAVNSFRSTINCSIFLTGSNSKLLSGELATYLSGRYVSFRIMPFSFKEVCKAKGIDKKSVRDEDFMEYLNYGGMPQRMSMKTEYEIMVYLRDLYNSIVLRDIVLRSNIKEVGTLNRIVEYMVRNTSKTFSAKSILDYFKSTNLKVSTETMYKYIEHITSSCIMKKAVRYDIRGKRILTRLDKYYLADLGLAKINNTGFITETGTLIENVVYNELINRGYNVYVGKTAKGEIDFIVMNGEKREYYQVAYLLADDKVIQREFSAFDPINDNYPKFVLSMDRLDFSRNGIKHINIIDFITGE